MRSIAPTRVASNWLLALMWDAKEIPLQNTDVVLVAPVLIANLGDMSALLTHSLHRMSIYQGWPPAVHDFMPEIPHGREMSNVTLPQIRGCDVPALMPERPNDLHVCIAQCAQIVCREPPPASPGSTAHIVVILLLRVTILRLTSRTNKFPRSRHVLGQRLGAAPTPRLLIHDGLTRVGNDHSNRSLSRHSSVSI